MPRSNIILSILLLACFASVNLYAAAWSKINLPNLYEYPLCPEGQKCEKPLSYSTVFPSSPLKWSYENDCQTYRSPSTRWVSNELKNVEGISFKGTVSKLKIGNTLDEFAMFFHELQCYGKDKNGKGGMEYGFVFRQDMPTGLFYLCGNCNIKPGQSWCEFPGSCPIKTVPNDNCNEVIKGLANPLVYRYWNAKVNATGDYIIELVDPKTGASNTCTIQKPDWAPNMYNATGYITINAKKESDVPRMTPAPFINFDTVKIMQP